MKTIPFVLEVAIVLDFVRIRESTRLTGPAVFIHHTVFEL